MEKIKELKEIIEKSNLPSDSKNFWFEFLDSVEKYKIKELEISIDYILDFLKERPDKLENLTDILMHKIEALKEMKREKWKEVLNEEEEMINKL